ncbi:MAG: hypothetical protein AB1715_13135, partial [Acidobacteriota bacterium]
MKRMGLAFLIFSLNLTAPALAQTAVEGRGVWAHPGDFGKSEQEVEAVFRTLQKAHIQLVVPLVKDVSGLIYWQSKKFPEAVHPDYRTFDLLRALTSIAPKYG